ncbi:hypothetical protein [Duganella sp. BuS-21]|uniref:plasmid mobilization protein n=1 Tax=Duganella sp. BuS-21 TaxID=2943848 RepID=UPI0035A70742
MTERSRFIKVRVSDGEYAQLRLRADSHGVTMSEHVRATVATVHQSVDVVAELAALRQQIHQATSPTTTFDKHADTEQREMLLLLRELAAARDAQILARVRAQLSSRDSGGQQRGVSAAVVN